MGHPVRYTSAPKTTSFRSRESVNGCGTRERVEDFSDTMELSRLVEEVIGAGSHRMQAIFRAVVVGEHDDPWPYGKVKTAQPAQYVEPVAAPKLYIEYDGIRSGLQNSANRIVFCVGRADHACAPPLRQTLHHPLAQYRRVLD